MYVYALSLFRIVESRKASRKFCVGVVSLCCIVGWYVRLMASMVTSVTLEFHVCLTCAKYISKWICYALIYISCLFQPLMFIWWQFILVISGSRLLISRSSKKSLLKVRINDCVRLMWQPNQLGLQWFRRFLFFLCGLGSLPLHICFLF